MLFSTKAVAALSLLAATVSSSPAVSPRAAAAPVYDEEVAPALAEYPLPAILTLDMIPAIRQQETAEYNAETVLGGQPFTHVEHAVPSYQGYNMTVSVITPDNIPAGSSRPWVYYIHGGGLILGNRFYLIAAGFELAHSLGLVIVTAEYRLAPAHPAPAAIEDVYAGLVWAANNAQSLGLDPSKALVWGSSSGGGLAAALGMMVRDRKPTDKLTLKGLMLHYPMLDNSIAASEQAIFSGNAAPAWSAETDQMAWKAYLGDKPGDKAKNPYYVPARAKNLANLPPVFIDTGSAELFRSPVAKFTQALWEAGNLVESHVSAGAFHGSDVMVPTARVSQRAWSARYLWITDKLTA